jgi:hypothetical protein
MFMHHPFIHPNIIALTNAIIYFASGVVKITGKAGDRKAIQATLEKIRVATKNDIAPLLPALVKQLNSLAAINGINEILLTEIKAASEGLAKIHSSIPKSKGRKDKDSASEVGSVPPLRSSSRNTTAKGGDSSGGFNIDMAEIRSITKRLGVCMCATELSKEFKDELTGIKASLEMKVAANDVVDVIVEKESVSLIAERNKEAAELLRLVGLSLQERSVALHEVIEAVTLFYINAADMLTAHEKENVRIDTSSEDAFFALLDKFEVDDKALEDEIKATVYALRHAPNTQALEENFQKALSLIESVEKNYRKYYGDAVALSEKHPVTVKGELETFRSKAGRVFGLVYNAAATTSDPAAPAEDVVVERPVWRTKLNDTYSVDTPLEAIVGKFFLGPPPPVIEAVEKKTEEPVKVEEPPVVVEVVAPVPGGKGGKDAGKGAKGAPPAAAPAVVAEPPPSESAPVEVPATEGVSEAPPEEKEEEPPALRPIPTDENGVPCLEALDIPETLLISTLSALRDEIFNQLEDRNRARLDMASALRLERQTEFTTELEERLRKHWPRRGRTDVMSYQPREGELTTHKQRYERHVRNLLLKNTATAKEFEDLAKSAEGEIEKYLENQEGLENALERQNNLAALQGVFKKGKDMRAEFKTATMERGKGMTYYAEDEPGRLLATNPEFIKTCKLFEDGGDYNVVEVQQAEEALKAAAAVVEAAIITRKARIESIRNREREALQSFSKFAACFEQCQQDLSMRDGLGQKYGGPRRNAQERLRSEFSRSDIQGENLDKSLDELSQLCNESPGSLADGDDTHLSVRIKRSLNNIRQAIIARAIYLNFVGEGKTLVQPSVTVNNEQGAADLPQGTPLPLPAPVPFLHVAEEASTKCKVETKALYISEGKEAALGATGVPAALAKYLEEQIHKAKAHREESCRHLRKQIERLEELLLSAPGVAIHDLDSWSRKVADSSRSDEEAVFLKKHNVLEQAKAKHKQDLKPQLSSPNAVPVLNALVSAEESRYGDAKKVLKSTLKKILISQTKEAEVFSNKLLHTVKGLLILLNSIPTNEQLGYLPGDENIVHKRKGLKRLEIEAEKKAQGLSIDKNEVRSWPGIELQSLDLKPELKALFSESPPPQPVEEKKVEVQAAPPKAGAKVDPKAKAAAPEPAKSTGATPAAPVEVNNGPLPCEIFKNEPISESVQSKATGSTRALLRTRNIVFDEFVQHYHSVQQSIYDKYSTLLKDEDIWCENWNRMVQYLKQQKV